MHGLSKWWQKWVLDAFLTHPPPLVAVVLTIFFSVFAIGFWCGHWLDQVDLAAYRTLNVFADNIRDKNLLEKMSNGLPIDVVYTWVNGSDPKLLEGLKTLSVNLHDSCPLSHCLPAPYISLLDSSVSDAILKVIPSVVEVAHPSITHNNRLHNFTVIHVTEEKHTPRVLREVSLAVGNGLQPKQAYWTSDVVGGWGMKHQHAVLVTGGSNTPHDTLLTSLFPHRRDIAAVCTIYGSSDVQVLECKDDRLAKMLLQSDTNIEISPNKFVKIRQAMLMLQPYKEDHMKDIDANRFEDNEELRYSLRSLEKHAPWIRKIFLVTNGQIPYWLNLDHPRLTIITHQEIFMNSSHLPSFSSPAIESHIHRIPGLSEHFLYLNDDVMLGSEVWPDDFFSPASGYKVYLSWSLPECSSGCPGSWLGDGYCDTSCNTTSCEWDGGDCAGEKGEGDLQDVDEEFGTDMSVEFCAPSCSDLWLADKYCDQSCNIQACGFDGGDCGLENIKELHRLTSPTSYNTTYILPQGVTVAWMNISSLLISSKIVEGLHTEHQGLRSVTVNTAQGLFLIILKSNITATLQIMLNITHKEQEQFVKKQNPVKYMFTIKCNSFPLEANKTKNVQRPALQAHTNIKNFTFDQVAPKLIAKEIKQIESPEFKYAYVNVNASKIPAYLVSEVKHLENMFKNGELTFAGLKKKKSALIEKYIMTSSDHELVFYQENEWVRGEIQDHHEVKDKNSSSETEQLPHHRNENGWPHIPTMNNGGSLNISQKHSSRSLLWSHISEHQIDEKFNVDTDTNLHGVQAFDSSKVRRKTQKRLKQEDGTLSTFSGNFPWEKQQQFPMKKFGPREIHNSIVPHISRRHLLDMFAESLLHVNRLYNSEYGYQARRVPAHMPHLINKKIMENLQDRFQEEFLLTSSHKIRQANDMQYAFSYFFFLMSEKRIRTPTEVFSTFDTDNSGTLSDREIRTLLTHVHDLPLHYNTVQELHSLVQNCSSIYQTKIVPTPVYERYADSDLPTVSLELVLQCEPLTAILKKMEKVHKYRYIHHSDDVVHFKMVTSNVSMVVHMLDEVRKNPRKFICLNSNLDPRSKDNDLIHALVQDTYESLFPVPSSFELPLNYRNRFLYVDELLAWRKWRDLIRALIYACLASLIFLTLINFFSTELEGLRRRWCRRRRRRDGFGGARV